MIKFWFDGEGGAAAGAAAGGAAGAGADAGAAAAAATAAAAAGAPKSFEIPADFDVRTLLPEDVRAHQSLAKFEKARGKDFIEQLVRSNISAQALIGADPNEMIKLPPADKVTAEQRADLLKRIGLPAKPEAWALKPLEKVVPGYEHDAPLGKWLSETASKIGIFPDQAQAIYEGFVKQAGAWQEEATNKNNATDKNNIGELQREYGKGFDVEVSAAKYGAFQLGGKEFVDKINSAGLGTDPVFFKAMAKIGKLLGEGANGGDKMDFGVNNSPAAIKTEADKLLRQAVSIMDTNPREAKRLNEEAQKIFARGN